ncbi:peptide chain release factor N(5)-glutamine methyltransferase [Planococcus shenhongbingii]|uniref:peptide chain release factor N(5)-glutamine methyltransferase n=1 Tax=Planococcus shenhongbingii TaxID=3058398 RepID=UPI0026118AFB|nr:peptide chain release factor N(5)-glutamine methyltransferase [Planococcus sp. N016]WKA57886.1 peptide chain release factor N(5)-glutamine methyltransferase [Planococcus sp. N016]
MTKSRRLYEALNGASSFLKSKGREEAVARILLQHELGLSHAGLLSAMRDEMDEAVFERYWSKIEQHAKGIPVQHLTGAEEFYGRKFQVNEDVLIPRPETEELVEETLRLVKEMFPDKYPTVADIGTGSGIIAITMKCELPGSLVTATDISEKALTMAKQNAHRLEADVHFKLGDLTEPIRDQKWDIILSNPPYISYEEAADLSDTVRDFEPHNALFADNNGLALYEKMADQLPHLLNKPGIVGFEIGYKQGPVVENLLKKAFPDATVYIKKDINNQDRMVFCINN